MDALIRSDKREAVQNFKSLLGQATGGAQMQNSQQGFMDQLQGQTRGKVGRRWASPLLQNIPSTQTQVLGSQKPKTDEVARNLIGQELSDLTFQAGGVGGLEALAFSGALNGQRRGRGRALGVEPVQFFFEGRNRR